MNRNAKRLVIGGLCAALFVVLSWLKIDLWVMKISLTGLPILIGAMMFGPVEGLMIGLVGEFISQMTGYGLTATTVLWILPPALLGFVIGLFAIRWQKTERELNPLMLYLPILLALAADTTLTTGVMWVDCQVYHYSFAVYAPYILWRYVADLIKAVLYAVIMPPILKAIRKTGST